MLDSWNLENDTTNGQTGSTTACSRPPADQAETGKSLTSSEQVTRMLFRGIKPIPNIKFARSAFVVIKLINT